MGRQTRRRSFAGGDFGVKISPVMRTHWLALAAVAGFPLGASLTSVKRAEAEAAILGGAMAGGAWVVWRLLEKHAPAPPMTERRRRTVGPGVWFGVAVAGALWFAFGMPDTMRLLPQPGPSMGLRPGAVRSFVAWGIDAAVRETRPLGARGTPGSSERVDLADRGGAVAPEHLRRCGGCPSRPLPPPVPRRQPAPPHRPAHRTGR